MDMGRNRKMRDILLVPRMSSTRSDPTGREQFSTWRISPRRWRSSVNFTALVVEDDTLQRETLADLLKDEGLEVIECTSAEAAELVVGSTGREFKADNAT